MGDAAALLGAAPTFDGTVLSALHEIAGPILGHVPEKVRALGAGQRRRTRRHVTAAVALLVVLAFAAVAAAGVWHDEAARDRAAGGEGALTTARRGVPAGRDS